MEAIILAGGLGTRLRGVIPNLPKPMAPINGKPFLEILLDSMDKKGFLRVVISTGYMADRISQYFGDKFKGLQIDYVVERESLGTGGGVRLALEQCKSDHVYVFNGDTYIDFNIHDVENIWLTDRVPIIICREVENVSRFGEIIVMNDKISKIKTNGIGRGLINAGCYVIPKLFLNNHSLGEKFSIEQDLQHKLENSANIRAYVTTGKFIDIGTPDDYKKSQVYLNGNLNK